MDFLKEKPRSIISIKSQATYSNIVNAIENNNLSNKHLRAVVNLCRSNPDSVMVVIYKSFENSILTVFGKKPVCVQCEGSNLEILMNRHSKEDYIYVFTYVK